MESYNEFAPFYDRFIRPVDYPARARYFDGLIRPLLGEGRLLLDLACGTGTLSIELSRLGYEVIGVDGSQEMLACAQQKGYEAGIPIRLFHQRMERLNLGGCVDCCVCALDSLNHITQSNNLRRALMRVAAHLLPGGVFVFDLNTPYKHRVLLAENCYCYEDEGALCVWRNHTEGLLTEIDLDFFTEQKDGSYLRTGESFSERGYERKEIEDMLSECGLETVALYGDDTRLPPTKETERWIFVTKKGN